MRVSLLLSIISIVMYKNFLVCIDYLVLYLYHVKL
nr:ALPV-224 [Albatrosspox virus]